MGDLGLISILVFGFISFLIIKFKITPVFLLTLIKSSIKNYNNSRKSDEIKENLDEEINQNADVSEDLNDVQPTIQNYSKIDQIVKKPIDLNNDDKTDVSDIDNDDLIDEIAIDIEKIKDEENLNMKLFPHRK